MLCMVAATLAFDDQWPQRVIAWLQVFRINKLSIRGFWELGWIDDMSFLKVGLLILIRDHSFQFSPFYYVTVTEAYVYNFLYWQNDRAGIVPRRR